MNITCRVFCLALSLGVAALAKADAVDFKMDVLDPPTNPAFNTNPIQSERFIVQFTACAPNELPGGMRAQGCFAGVNYSGKSWDNLHFDFPKALGIANQTANCTPSSQSSIFSSSVCPNGEGDFLLTFYNGVINQNQLFFIIEDGAAPSDFPAGIATVLPDSELPGATTPEPMPFLLIGTGLLLLPAFGRLAQAH